MEIHLTPEQETQLSQIAANRGRGNADALAQEVLTRFLEEEARFIEAVKLGEAELERGEYLSHAEVGERMERWFQS
jgi:predicted transcriptional regulator